MMNARRIQVKPMEISQPKPQSTNHEYRMRNKQEDPGTPKGNKKHKTTNSSR